jgi:WD40 repeat protein
VIEAIAAGEDLPERAVQVLSLAFSSNRLMGMADSAGPALGDPRIPGFNADGTRLATIVPGQGPRLWRLDGGRFVADRDLQADGLGLHSLVIGADEQVLGIGAGGIWRLPASEGAPPLYPCGSGAGAMFTLDAARRYLAIARNLRGEHHGVCVIDLAQDGKVLLDRELNEGEIRGLSFSPDGNALLTASAHGRTHVFDLMTGEIRLSLPAGGALGRPFNNAVFDQAGERIAIAAVDERVRLYGGDGTPIGELSDSDIGGRRFKIHRTAVRDVAFAPDGAFLVAVDDQGQVVRWSLDGSEQAVVLGNHDLSITDLEIVAQPDPGLSDQPLVLTASLDHTARLWGLATGRPVAVLGHDAAVTAARFSDNGNHVLTFSERDGTARLWSIDPVSRLTYRIRHPDHVWNLDMVAAPTELAPSGAGLLLATAGFDGGVRVWRYDRTLDEAKPEPLATFTEHGGRVRQVRFSPSGRLLSSAGYDGSAWVHDLVGGTACRASITGKRGGDEVYNALFGPDARWLLTTSNDSERPVRLFSATTCAPVDAGDAMRHGDAPVQAAAVQPVGGGALVATGDERGTVRLLFQGADGVWHKHCEVAAGIGPIGDIALSADGSLAGAVGTASRAVLLAVEADACRAPAYLNGHTERVYSIAIGPDSRRVVTASLDKTARVWGSDGTALAVLVGHQDRVYRAAFSPDGRWILSASRDGSIQLWQTPTATSGPEQRLSAFLPLRADLGGVANAMFSPGGRYIAGAYWENAALLWRLWSEADEVPSERTARWGRERARLALIGEAYRFRDENAVVDNDALEQAERE